MSHAKVRRQGKRAFRDGYTLEDNPYGCNNKLYQSEWAMVNWTEGWREEQEKCLEEEKSIDEIPLNEFETLGDLINALEEYGF